jgi:hypothetical protein
MEQNIEREILYEPPGFMVVKPDVMERALEFGGRTVGDFAEALEIDMALAYVILSGERIDIHPASRFINHYKAEFAHRYIDWALMGIPDPYRKIRKRNVKTRYFDRHNII